MNLNSKRLLILGGGNNSRDIHEFISKNNIILIVAGNKINSNLLEIANESYNINILDKNQLIDLIKTKNIDGVFVGGAEDIISLFIDVAEELNLPFYSSRKTWEITSNKKKFKDACKLYNIPVTAEYNYQLFNSNSIDYFPVVVKPTDSCGSNGVKLCYNFNELVTAIDNAKKISTTDSYIIEEYFEGSEIVIYYTFVDGNISFSSMCDRYNSGNNNTFNPLCELYSYPSKYINKYVEYIDKNMRKALLNLGIQNGITSIQGFYKNGRFKFFEMGFRLGGTAQYRYTKYLNGISSLEMMMQFALTGKMGEDIQYLDNPFFDKQCCTLSLISAGGIVGEIKGIEKVQKMKGVIHIENRYKIGDYIKPSNTVSQFHIRVFTCVSDLKSMKELLNKIQDTIKVYDNNGNNMIINRFNPNKLDKIKHEINS